RSKLMPGALLGLGLLIVLLANAPARLLLAIVPDEQIILEGVSGSLWSGRASRVLVASGSGWLHLGTSSWRLSPLSLLTLAPRLDVNSQWGRQTLKAEVSLHSSQYVELRQLELLLDAALLQQYLPVALLGDIAMQFEEVVVRDRNLETANGRIVWQEGGWLSPQGRRQLGSYALDVKPATGGGVVAEVITLAGDLQASGPVALKQSDYSIDVLLSGAGLDDPQLRQALQLVAIPEGDDYRVKLQGSL
ncbi:MAG: type II secretion system protein N, partial [Halioglobus sp.]